MKLQPPVLNGAAVLPPLEVETAEYKPDKAAKKQAASRFAVLNGFVDSTLAGLCRGELAAWLILFRDSRDGSARTSQADIARRAGMSKRGVAKSLKRLEKAGLLECLHRGGLNQGASRYQVKPLLRNQ